MIFDWAESKSLCFTLSESSVSPAGLALLADEQLQSGVRPPAAFPHDLHWLILTTSTTGAYSSFAFGAELPRVARLAKRLTEFGVPFGRLLVEGSSPGRAPHTPSGPSLFAGEEALHATWIDGGVSATARAPLPWVVRAGYCEKKGGGTSLFGSEAFKRRFLVIQPPSPGVLSPSG